ncbi:AraC family transcriptional regulator [Pseudoxanthomonas gei]|uniref:AraC family transcriptional regulator n=1 Tax=Pseudoxanthomonas gei TaxID=1383030 RepID=UPI001B882A52
MHARLLSHHGTARSATTAVADLFVHECEHDQPRVAIPQPEVQLVVRLGSAARDGLDVHAMGIHPQAHRKIIRGGQRTVFARLHWNSCEAVLGMPASEVAGRIVAIEELWGVAASQRLLGRIAEARDTAGVASVLEEAIAERIARSDASSGARAQLASSAMQRLGSGNLDGVAFDLGVSERHLRRVFRQAVGVSPKTFAKLTRFHHALAAARNGGGAGWADIAASAGYYDQAHLIAEFRAIAGATPRALLAELRAAG